jgi:NADPH-dependent 2,4-dienoyl-CoA reductase/sulfur reductase-like enzyme/nitrite reductase/ring-hydroxylating ferredoxin subunit
MSEPLPLSGPDLAVGIPVSDVPEGGLVRGHAGGAPVLLSRVDGGFHAVGAACTHYGAPLDEGLRVGGTVRCPWHHACFDLRTGDAIRAPALQALPRYAVALTDGVVRVVGPAPACARPEPRGGPASVVVVGAGAAGAAAVEALRQAGYDGPVTLFGREPGPPVDRPNLSKDYLAGTAPEEWLALRDEGFYREQQVTLRTGVEVVGLDVAARRIVLSDGSTEPYGACLLATGAYPVQLPIPGADSPHVFTLRSLADSRAIVAAAMGARRAVVVGASFIGLEVAAALRTRGVEVDVVAPESLPLERILGPALGAAVKDVHERNGVVFHLGRTPAAIEGGEVLLSDGARLPADLVVIGVGVRPATALAERAGLAVDRGVLVDAYLRTSAEGVWAAGDIARWPDPHTGERQRIEHWALAQRQGQVAARNLLGGEERFDAVPFFWSVHFDMCVNVVGFPSGGDRIDIDGDLGARDAALAFRRGDRTLAVATVGRDRTCLDAEVLLEQDDHAGLARLVPASPAATG